MLVKLYNTFLCFKGMYCTEEGFQTNVRNEIHE